MPMTLAPVTPATRKLLSSGEFLAWLKPGVFADFIRGVILRRLPVSLRRAQLVNLVDRRVSASIADEAAGELHREPVAIRVSIRATFMPILACFTQVQAARLPDSHAPFKSASVMAALAHTTANNDLARKSAAYETHGVRGGGILDADQLDHQLYRLCRLEGNRLSQSARGDTTIHFGSIAEFGASGRQRRPGVLPPGRSGLTRLPSNRRGPARRRGAQRRRRCRDSAYVERPRQGWTPPTHAC